MNQINPFKEKRQLRQRFDVKAYCAFATLLLLLLSVRLPLQAMVKDKVLKTHANMMVELAFITANTYPDPFNQASSQVKRIATTRSYIDDRPTAKYRLDAKDQGVV